MQLTQQQSDILYPTKTNKLYFLTHVLNEEDCIERLLTSVQHLTSNILVLIDDRTTDRTADVVQRLGVPFEYFKWTHSFSRAKNEAIRIAMEKYGLQYGDWLMMFGADFELNQSAIPEIKSFIGKSTNCFASFKVKEKVSEYKVTIIQRSLMWRHHPEICWERPSHENSWYSASRLVQRLFPDKEPLSFPFIGGNDTLVHFGDAIDDPEILARKGKYYYILFALDTIRCKQGFPDTIEGMQQAIDVCFGYPQDGLDDSINLLMQMNEYPEGLKPDWEFLRVIYEGK